MPKCLKCDLDNVPEDHALRCPMRKQDNISFTYSSCNCGLNSTACCPIHSVFPNTQTWCRQ